MPSRRALLIGVPSHLFLRTITPLPFIRDDMARLKASLETSGYDVTTVGIDEQSPAVRTFINRSIEEFCGDAEAGDTLLICLSGHGLHYAGSDYLMPADGLTTPASKIHENLVEIDFGEAFERSSAETILVFVDACREAIPTGEMSVVASQRWSEGTRTLITPASAYVFACGPHEFSRYVTTSDGDTFSLFSRALAEVMNSSHPATTFGEVRRALQQRLDELADRHSEARQHIRVPSEFDSASHPLNGRVICKGSTSAPARRDDLWGQAARDSALWPLADTTQGALLDDLRAQVAEMVVACRTHWERASRFMPGDGWRDEQYPVRVLRHVDGLARQCSDLNLSVAEAAVLIAAPFVREAVLAAATVTLAQANPLDIKSTGSTHGPRAALERVYLSLPHLVRSAERLLARGRKPEHDAIATWFLHRCLLREPEIWASEPPGYIPKELDNALQWPSQRAKQLLTRGALTRDRLLELARCIHADPERIERRTVARPLRELDQLKVAEYLPDAQPMREKLLAYLLALAGRMALDVRSLGEALVDHIGQGDAVMPSRVVAALAQAQWSADPTVKTLEATCQHPALDLALQEYVQEADQVLEKIRQEVSHQQPRLSPLGGLPQRLSEREIKPAADSAGRSMYETPHLRFQLAQNEVRELLMGEQLYRDRSLAIRELYQNALDACRYREARQKYLKVLDPSLEAEWQGRIVFRQGSDEHGRPYIECKDNGVGMGREELTKAFAQAGRRFSDMPEFIEERAEWLRCKPPIELYPNSQFGIGVLSYFMLADELEITTRRFQRDGSLGHPLRITISGGGSLFRISAGRPSSEAGTTVRLYLNQTHYVGSDNREVPISCLRTLRELLWVAQFRTEVYEGGEHDVWEPGELKAPGILPESIVKPEMPDLWWVGDSGERTDRKEAETSVSLRDEQYGRVLSDGLVTDQQLNCAIVNLHQVHRPKLTVDRRSALEWDRSYVASLMRTAVIALVEHPQWLTYAWLWKLEQQDIPSAEILFSKILEHHSSLSITIHRLIDIKFPLHQMGCFSLDMSIMLNPYSPTLDGYYVGQEQFTSILPAILMPYRALAYIRSGVDTSTLLHRLNNISSVEKISPISVPGDGLVLKNAFTHNESTVLVPRIVGLAVQLGESINITLERLQKYECLGVVLPITDTEYVSRLQLTEQDAIVFEIVSTNEITRLQILLIAGRLKISVGAVIKKLKTFLPLGIIIPEVQQSESDNIFVTSSDYVILNNISINTSIIRAVFEASFELTMPLEATIHALSRFATFDPMLGLIDIKTIKDLGISQQRMSQLEEFLNNSSNIEIINPVEIIRAAFETRQSIGLTIRQLQALSSPSTRFPSITSDLEDIFVSEEGLKLLSRDLDARAPWLSTNVPLVHIAKASLALDKPISELAESLQSFSCLGLAIPSVQFLHNMALLSQEDIRFLSLLNIGPYLSNNSIVPVWQIASLAQNYFQSIGNIVRRFQRLELLGIHLPSIHSASFDEFFVDANDVSLLYLCRDEEVNDTPNFVSAACIVVAAVEFAQPIRTVLEHVRRFEPLGLVVPAPEPNQVDSIQLTIEDLIVLSKNLNGLPPWIGNTVPFSRIMRSAVRLCQPVGAVLRQLGRFVPLGMVLPAVDPGDYDDLRVGYNDLIALSEDRDGQAPWLEAVPADQLRRAACVVRQTPEQLLERLQRFAPLGLSLPAPETIGS